MVDMARLATAFNEREREREREREKERKRDYVVGMRNQMNINHARFSWRLGPSGVNDK